ncbi:ECF subfamily RNA polymerase sigma factor, BldN family [Streptomyces sp. SS7]|uniref:ECF subfamily RNA polymerase sigma factor, BldN family n=1 Tax=unclassified Streptomyces TaxID=2593676 RepID=UPI00099E79EA|nr:ECF subfamily RNA polymerase sigma factor, BldN family [Streptomyces sp. DSM 15324]
MYPHVGVDASGLATLRATVATIKESLRVPTAYGVPALATAVPAGPAGPCYALAESSAAVGRRGRSAGGATTPARRPAADSDSARMMDLVERAQAGEADAFGRLYDQYSDTVYRYIYYRVGGKATAEDLTSETFLRALRRIGTFTWQGRDFGAWLVTIARNLVADHFKSSRFRLEVTTGEMLDANEVERSPEDSVLESLSNAALLDAVRRLNPQQQECVTLRFLQGLSVAETARVMGKNEGAIKTLQYRAVRTLARLLPDDAR